MNKEKVLTVIVLVLMAIVSISPAIAEARPSSLNYELGPIPDTPDPLPENSVQMGDARSFEEVKLDLPVTPGPFEPTWESIEANYPGTPDWLREAKFGLWIHFGPQSAGKSGDWYARKLYTPGTLAYKNHLKNYGHPSEVGYKEVLRDWNPDKLDPAKLVEIYWDAGVRFLIIQGVHHDQFDSWDSKYQPWNSTRLGPKRDLIGEWEQAARKAGIRFGITFHHEYAWWWDQNAFQSDAEGPKAGIPYDGNLTLADGKGKWWEGLDPRLLYGINLREYKDVISAVNHAYRPPKPGIFTNHLEFAEWYAKWWALRMMDAVDKYQPDFIYTDGTDQQPFSGFGTGTGYKCDAMQRVIADFYNKTLARRGKVDVFSIVKFRSKTNGTVNTQEARIPRDIKTDQDWIGETPVGDWFYRPGFTYTADGVVRYLLEQVARDGNMGLCVSLLPDGSLDEGSSKMLKEVGLWMRINGKGIYGSRAWEILGEGTDGKLNVLPGGGIGDRQARYRFSTSDLRFTVGKDGCLYAFCMTVPEAGQELRITSLGTASNLLAEPITSVTLLGYDGTLKWSQDADALRITCPDPMNFQTAIGFKIGPATIIRPTTPSDFTAESSDSNITLSWTSSDTKATYTVKRAKSSDGPYKILTSGLSETTYVDTSAAAGILYYYVVASNIGTHASPDSRPMLALLPTGSSTWLSQDVGTVAVAGSSVQANNTLLVRGSGSDIWNSADAFHYVYKTLDGDGSITAKVESMQNTAPWAKAGLMIRESLDANSRQVIAFMSPNEGVALQGRSNTGGSTSGFAHTAVLTAPHWLRLERSGDLFTAYHSSDGSTWATLGSTTMTMATDVKIGLAVTSHRDGLLCNAIFNHVEMKPQTDSAPVNRPGKSDGRITSVQNITQTPTGAKMELDGDQLQVEFVTDRIARIRATQNPEWSQTPSLILAEITEKPGRIAVKEKDNSIELRSSKLTVRVDRKTGAVSYYDPEGKLLLSEAAAPRAFRKVDVIKSLPDPTTVKKVQTVDGEREVAGRYVQSKDREAWEGQVSFTLTDDEALYGLGFDEDDDLNLRGKSKRLYQHNMRILVPSLVSTKGYGLLFDAYSAMSFKDGSTGMSMSFDVINELDYYFIAGQDMNDVVAGYRQLTGKASMLPRWAYGYVQSKERYVTQDELVATLREFRERNIPIDVIVQDWNYWKGGHWGSPVPDPSRYPDIAKMTQQVHDQHAHLMISIWPNPSAKDSPGRELTDSGYMLSGSNYVDFYNPNAGKMYFRHVWQHLGQYGIDAWWCDSTEPEVKDWTRTRPENADEVNIQGLAKVIDPQWLNAYGLVGSQQFYTNWRNTMPNKRLVNLTRSGYAGSQHVGAVVWTGDVTAKWSTLAQQVAAILSFSAAGDPYVTTDIGAFFVKRGKQWFWAGDYNEGVDDIGYRELYTRWFQFGAFLPMFRSHGTDTPREPWRFGEPGTPFYDAIVSSIQLRYRLLPYFYSLGGMVHHADASFIRPLAFDFPEDKKTHDLKTQMLVGEELMVCPVLEPMYYERKSKSIENADYVREVYLPKDKWIDFWTGKTLEGPKTVVAEAPIERIPLYVKAGSILPMGPEVQYANEKPDAPYEIRIYPGEDAKFVIYEDDNETYDYENGEYVEIPITWNDEKEELTIGKRKGKFPGMIREREFHVVWVSPEQGVGMNPVEQPDTVVKYVGKAVAIAGSGYRRSHRGRQ